MGSREVIMATKAYGIDFGTSTIKIYKKGQGIVLDEHNVIAIADRKTVIASGEEAYEMYEKAPSNIMVSYPVRSGVIADVANMTALLNHFMMRINGNKRPGAADYIVATPTDITDSRIQNSRTPCGRDRQEESFQEYPGLLQADEKPQNRREDIERIQAACSSGCRRLCKRARSEEGW